MSRVLTVLLKKLTQMELTLRKVFINFFVKLCVKIEISTRRGVHTLKNDELVSLRELW